MIMLFKNALDTEKQKKSIFIRKQTQQDKLHIHM